MAIDVFLPVVQPGRGPSRASVFDRIAIVGLGPLGAAVALGARRAFPSALVIGVDRSDRLETCVRLGAIDIGAVDPIVVADADLVVLAVPRAEQERWLSAVAELIPGRALISSLQSDEGPPDGVCALPARLRFIAGHVQAAPVTNDLRQASADAVVGAAWALAATETDAEASKLAAFASGLGARPVMIGSEAGFDPFLRQRPEAV